MSAENRPIHPYANYTISMFMCTFDGCGFSLEHNIICHNATSRDDNMIANSLTSLKSIKKH